MHELSVAQRLVEVVSDALSGQTFTRVTAIRMRIGPLSGVVPKALLFCFDMATADTPISGAQLLIEQVTVAAWCQKCGAERDLPDMAKKICPTCGHPTPKLTRGRELEIISVEVDDEHANCSGQAGSSQEER